MKITPPFEIRVAFIGYVSVGKTTILNAILKNKFSEVSMKRTTAGINIFRVSAGQKADDGPSKEGPLRRVWTAAGHHTPDSTLQEIINDNKILRNSKVIHEKTFDIELDEALFAMKKDTVLTLIDIPGINEAGTSKKYNNYVLCNWHTFDCAVIVLDGRQGVNTEEQVELLKMAQENCQQVKKVPVIVLMNKIDDPEEEEQRVLVEEATKAIETMFGAPDRAKALQDIVSGKAGLPETNKVYSPVVIGISAIHAFIYRMASNLSFEMFTEKVDKAMVDKLGRHAYGLRWKRFNATQRTEKAFEVIRDKEQYNEGLEASRFHHFLSALSFCVGGSDTQDWLIERQIETSTIRLTQDNDYVSELKSLYDNYLKLGRPVDFVSSQFTDLFKSSAENAFRDFAGPEEVHRLAKPMNDLVAYVKLVKHMGTADTAKSEIIEHAKNLVLRQVGLVLSPEPWKYKYLTGADWVLIVGSMIGVLSNDCCFSEYLVLPRILLEKRFHNACAAVAENAEDKKCDQCKNERRIYGTLSYCSNCCRCFITKAELQAKLCRNCQVKGCCNSQLDTNNKCVTCCGYVNVVIPLGDPLQYQLDNEGKLVPSDPENFKNNIHFEMVDSPLDPKHFGHLIFRFGQLLDFVNE